MINNRNQVIQYINKCPNCCSAVLGTNGKCKTMYISYKRVFENIIVLAVNKKEIVHFKNAANQHISVVFWDKLMGYQLKGCRISDKEILTHSNKIDELKDDIVDTSNTSFLLFYIDHIYNVTPGKFAGKLVL
jgi:hypothetical protein